MDVASERPALAPDPYTSTHAGEIQIVYAMEVIDPIRIRNGGRYVRRFTYETREEAWAKYSEAIRCGFAAYVEVVGRMRASKRTSSQQRVTRSSSSATSRSPREGAVHRNGGVPRSPGGSEALNLRGSSND